MASTVTVTRAPINIPTYEPQAAQQLPMFLERRVYQGSSGRVYPMPCIERFADKATDHQWDGITIANGLVEVLILPELGGRIHAAKDLTNGFDFIYRQGVIKPALIGLAGAWASGGIEFNWPQHHRPSTFMPCDVEIERHADGSVTVWMSEHDPLFRMKGMHGVCLHPGRSVIELKVRAYNRTTVVQTFLWWANVAIRVHEGYQSFMPTDVSHVGDHAKGSIASFPRCAGVYYGIDYGRRGREGVPAADVPPSFVPPHCRPGQPVPEGLDYTPDDLSWYANIPVPTSYMCLGSTFDFFGGYDHLAKAGVVHVANHHISPGKKQWTWGNHEFGYAWDRNLTDVDGPYIELMAGVYTDNQPDFAFLMPGETKTWSQYWFPIQGIGTVQQAGVEGALHLSVTAGRIRLGAMTTRRERVAIRLTAAGRTLWERTAELAPDQPLVEQVALPAGVQPHDLRLAMLDGDARERLAYQIAAPVDTAEPATATEPPPPAQVASIEELYLTGVHLTQYRHPTRMPEPYFAEALRRDPGDARTNVAVGSAAYIDGRFAVAEQHARAAIARLTHRNPNPADGEAFHLLGLALRAQADQAALGVASDGRSAARLLDDAYAAFYKATWNQAWQSAAFVAIAEIDLRRGEPAKALEHLDRALRVNTDHLWARNLRVVVLRRLGRSTEADAALAANRALDRLDWLARHLAGEAIRCDAKTRLDFAHDLARAGLYAEALNILADAEPSRISGTAPMLAYTRAAFCQLAGDRTAAADHLRSARVAAADYCFPARLEEAIILAWAIAQGSDDARAMAFLGQLYFDRKRHAEAMELWERSLAIDPAQAVTWRNLGQGRWNARRDGAGAAEAYARARALDPRNPRLLFEADLLAKRRGVPVGERLAALESAHDLIPCRDDLAVEYADLLNQSGRHREAEAFLASRRFQPWEGGEGLARGQHVRTQLALSRAALAAGDAAAALRHAEAADGSPANLGEAKHLLVNDSEVQLVLGDAAAAMGDHERTRRAWTRAADKRGDFQERVVKAASEQTYCSALALRRLGRTAEADALLTELGRYARQLATQEAKVSYFATSLPARLLFDDPQQVQGTTALLLEAQSELGLGRIDAAERLLREVLVRDPARSLARDLLATIPARSAGRGAAT
jgi:tetratricopeptide (TPR) repeat protein